MEDKLSIIERNKIDSVFIEVYYILKVCIYWFKVFLFSIDFVENV